MASPLLPSCVRAGPVEACMNSPKSNGSKSGSIPIPYANRDPAVRDAQRNPDRTFVGEFDGATDEIVQDRRERAAVGPRAGTGRGRLDVERQHESFAFRTRALGRR